MTLEEAITSAIECKRRVRRVYLEAVEEARHPVAQKVFQMLAGEEQQQIDYLMTWLESLKQAGRVALGNLHTAIPSSDEIDRCILQIKNSLPSLNEGCELNILRNAMEVDQEVTHFLKRMRDEFSDETREIFEHFLAVEEGHAKILQAEIDSIEKNGFWFDIQEFGLE